ncbi:MAG: DUF4157 domain-containing protein [Myxococcales bacterium]|nr:DUF4157 domain-containing protein [Myxococcales bacterium]
MPKSTPAPAPKPQRPTPEGAAPQKTDLAGLAALQRRMGNRATVRLLGGETLRAVARQGMSGPGSTLSHHATLQRSLGAYDISGVRSHIGRAAGDATSLLGAKGYAMGEAMAFSRPPDLRSAAHEMAHVLGQRVGFMPSGAHGRAGDGYERFAEGFAETVTRGRSVEGLVDRTLGRGAMRPRAKSAKAPVQFEIGPGQHGAIVTGHAFFYEAVACGKDHYLLYDVVHEDFEPRKVSASDPDYKVIKKPEEAQAWLAKRPKKQSSKDKSGTKKVSFEVDPPEPDVDELDVDELDDEIPISSDFVSMYDELPLKRRSTDSGLLSRTSLKAKGGGRSKISKLLSRSTATLYQTKYTELLDALDAYGKATSDEDRHKPLADIIGHAQHWLATHPRASRAHGDSLEHQAKFSAVEAVRDAAREEFMQLAGGRLTADPDAMGQNERMMYMLDDILRDPLFAAIYDAMHHGIFDGLMRSLKKGRTYVKMLPVVNLVELARESRKANRRKERSRAMQEIGDQSGQPLLAHVGHALSEHYRERRKKIRITGGVSALLTPLTFAFPFSAAIGQGASGLTDVGGQAVAKAIDKPTEKLVSFASEKGIGWGKDKDHERRGGKALTEAFAAAVSRFTLDPEVIRAIVLYLGLGPREDDDSPQERSRLALKEMLGADAKEDLLDVKEPSKDDKWLKARLTARQKGKGVGPDDKDYSALVSDDVEDKGTNWLRALWVSEGFLGDEERRGKSGAKKLVKDEAASSKDDDSKELLSGLGSGKKDQSKGVMQSMRSLFGSKSEAKAKAKSKSSKALSTFDTFDDELFDD